MSQRLFAPRSALAFLTVLAVIGATRRTRKVTADTRQVQLFNE